MGWLSKAFGSLTGGDILGVAGSIASGLFNKSSASSAQQAAQAYNTEVLQNRHQWEVADLRAAGLNPILSATNSSGGAGIGVGSAGSMPDIGQSINSGKSLRIQEKGLDIERDKVQLEKDKYHQMFELWKSQIANNEALTSKLLEEAIERRTRNSYLDYMLQADYDIKIANIENIRASTNAYHSAAYSHYMQGNLSAAMIGQVNASIDSIRAAIPKMVADGICSQNQAKLLNEELDFYKEHPNARATGLFFKTIGGAASAGQSAAEAAIKFVSR